MDRISFSHFKYLSRKFKASFPPTQAGGEALGDRPGCSPAAGAPAPALPLTPTPTPGGLTPLPGLGALTTAGLLSSAALFHPGRRVVWGLIL